MIKNRAFSLYDIEELLKEAGAEKINQGAVFSLEKELESTVNELVSEVQVYANHAGRPGQIRDDDVKLLDELGKPQGNNVPSRPRARIAAKMKRRMVKIDGIVFTRAPSALV